MALTATIHHFAIDLSDVDRGVYTELDLRVARHPSETLEYLLTRVLAYCLFYEEGIAFTRGLSTAEEPAIWVKDPADRVTLWIDVGAPSAERLHKASKAAPRVVVFTHHDPETLKRQLRAAEIHRAEELAIYALPRRWLDEVGAKIERRTRLALVRNQEELYVTVGGRDFTTRLERHTLD